MADASRIVQQYLKALADGDVDTALGLYADQAVVVSFGGVAEGVDQIRSFLVGFLAAYDSYDLVSIDQLRAIDDLIVWDATIETGAGLLQVTNVVTLDDGGRFLRHVPSIRGYWGKS